MVEIRFAWICVDCDIVFTFQRKAALNELSPTCPRCGTQNVVSLSRILNRAEDKTNARHPVATEELAELELAKKRYEKVRRMHPISWLRIYNDALMGKGTFDELVDKWKGEP